MSRVIFAKLACFGKWFWLWAFLLIREKIFFLQKCLHNLLTMIASARTYERKMGWDAIRFMQIAKCILCAIYVFYNKKHTYLYSVTVLMFWSVREHALSVKRNKMRAINQEKRTKKKNYKTPYSNGNIKMLKILNI